MGTYPTRERLHELFFYLNGKLIWKTNRGLAKAGTIGGTLN
jgi:hypothetical protein